MLDASQAHPSPPTVFSLSPSLRFLLSASSHPPIIYLTSISRYSEHVLLHPQCSASAVVAAAFHPERANNFALAYADGTIAVYNALHLDPKNGRSPHRKGLAGSEMGPEIGYITKVHATISQTQSTNCEAIDSVFHGYDPGSGTVGIGSETLGITAIAFIPGLKATVMSVGADGKCCMVDFAVPKHQSNNSSRIRKVKSWHLGSPGTRYVFWACISTVYPRVETLTLTYEQPCSVSRRATQCTFSFRWRKESPPSVK